MARRRRCVSPSQLPLVLLLAGLPPAARASLAARPLCRDPSCNDRDPDAPGEIHPLLAERRVPHGQTPPVVLPVATSAGPTPGRLRARRERAGGGPDDAGRRSGDGVA